MSELQIVTNNVPRDVVTWHDVPEKIAKSDFDYVPEDDRYSERFVCYRGWWYDLGDMQAIKRWPNNPPVIDGNVRVNDDSPFAKWDMVHGDSYFSGVLFRYVNDGFDQVVCATYFS